MASSGPCATVRRLAWTSAGEASNRRLTTSMSKPNALRKLTTRPCEAVVASHGEPAARADYRPFAFR